MGTPIRIPRGAVIAIATSFIGALPGCAPTLDGERDRSVGVPLTASRINAGQTGRAALIPLGERTQVTVTISGVPPQVASRPVHLYTFIDEGACGDDSPKVAWALTERVLAQSPSSTAIAPVAGPFMITNVAPVPLDRLREGRYAIRIMTSPADGNREIFCGSIR